MAKDFNEALDDINFAEQRFVSTDSYSSKSQFLIGMRINLLIRHGFVLGSTFLMNLKLVFSKFSSSKVNSCPIP